MLKKLELKNKQNLKKKVTKITLIVCLLITLQKQSMKNSNTRIKLTIKLIINFSK
jgi:hypothetical protein